MNITSPSITIQNAHLTYQRQCIFDALSLALPQGQWTCLLGPSGVGKTSLLRMLAGLLPLDANVAADIQTSDGQSLKHQVAYMAQTDLLMPWLSAKENVCLGAKLRHGKITKNDIARARELLHAVNLPDIGNKKPYELSGGMRQRVALARTLFENKPVVLMDEPFAAVDALTRLHLQNLAAELLRDKTVFLITHDPWEALRLGQQILVLRGVPAKLSEPMLLHEQLPRQMEDVIWLERHAMLLQELGES